MILNDAIEWLMAPERWSGRGSIPQRLIEHVGITLSVVLMAAIIAIPIGLGCLILAPMTSRRSDVPLGQRWKKLDLVGVSILTGTSQHILAIS